MKSLPLAVVPVVLALALAACESINTPLSSDSTFDPLRPPGSGIRSASAEISGSEFTPGQFVSANIPNTAFYKNKPKGTEDADKLVDKGTNMKIISTDGSYAKVELDNGEIGYVPSVMIGMPSTESSDILQLDGAYQVYPPLPDTGPLEPLPTFDASGLPPEGAIPAIIDPEAPLPSGDAPITIDPIPDLTPSQSASAVPEIMPVPSVPTTPPALTGAAPTTPTIPETVPGETPEDALKKAAVEKTEDEGKSEPPETATE